MNQDRLDQLICQMYQITYNLCSEPTHDLVDFDKFKRCVEETYRELFPQSVDEPVETTKNPRAH